MSFVTPYLSLCKNQLRSIRKSKIQIETERHVSNEPITRRDNGGVGVLNSKLSQKNINVTLIQIRRDAYSEYDKRDPFLYRKSIRKNGQYSKYLPIEKVGFSLSFACKFDNLKLTVETYTGRNIALYPGL